MAEAIGDEYSVDIEKSDRTALIFKVKNGEETYQEIKDKVEFITEPTERYIKWLEVIQNPEKYNRIHPDDFIPMYIAKIPQNFNGEISFYFPDNRTVYLKNIIQDISEKFSCPFNRRVKYPPFKSPIRIAMDKMSY